MIYRFAAAVFFHCILPLKSYSLDIENNPQNLNLVDDIYVPCYFTVQKIGREYFINNSSPKDCGSISKLTGRIKTGSMKIECPPRYYSIGRVSGGPVGSFEKNIFYRAESLCRFNLAMPL